MQFKRLDLQSSRQQKHLFKKYQKILIIAAIVIFLMVFWSMISSTSSVFKFAFPIGPKFKSTDSRVNVLLLGYAGGTHQGATLTDSIIVASVNIKTGAVILISIPRDLWLDSVRAKINTVYQDGGLKYAEDKIDDILAVPIHYGMRIDFSGFIKAIDLVEGVEVNISNAFDDYNYPIEGKENDLCGLKEKEVDLDEDQIKALNIQPGGIDLKPGKTKVLVNESLGDTIATSSADFACRFEHIAFSKGKIMMDGKLALKFVRSRAGTNGEGSDFARSKRQQLVLQAFRNQVLSLETLINPQKVSGLVSTFGKSFETDINPSLLPEFYGLLKKVNGVKSLVLGDLGGGKSILVSPPPADYGGAYVLIPPNNDFKSIKELIKQELDREKEQK